MAVQLAHAETSGRILIGQCYRHMTHFLQRCFPLAALGALAVAFLPKRTEAVSADEVARAG